MSEVKTFATIQEVVLRIEYLQKTLSILKEHTATVVSDPALLKQFTELVELQNEELNKAVARL